MVFEVFAGLAAAFFWGISDFLTVKPIRAIGSFRAFFYGITFSLLVLGCYVFFVEGFVNLPAELLLLVITSSFFNVFAWLLFFASIKKGLLSIASSISSLNSVFIVGLSVIFLGEVLSLTQWAGVALAVLGSVLVCFKFSEVFKTRKLGIESGAFLAFLAAIFWGVSLFFFKPISQAMQGHTGEALLALQAATLIFLAAIGLLQKKDFAFPDWKNYFTVSGAATLNAIGTFAFLWGLSQGFASLIAPVGALFPAVTVACAFLFLKERLEASQILGLLLALAALVLLSA